MREFVLPWRGRVEPGKDFGMPFYPYRRVADHALAAFEAGGQGARGG